MTVSLRRSTRKRRVIIPYDSDSSGPPSLAPSEDEGHTVRIEKCDDPTVHATEHAFRGDDLIPQTGAPEKRSGARAPTARESSPEVYRGEAFTPETPPTKKRSPARPEDDDEPIPVYDNDAELIDHILEHVIVGERANDVYQNLIVKPTPKQLSTLLNMGCSRFEIDQVRTVDDINHLFDKHKNKPTVLQLNSLRERGIPESKIRLIKTKDMASELIGKAKSLCFATNRQMKLIRTLRRDANVTTEMPADMREDEAHQYIQQLKTERPPSDDMVRLLRDLGVKNEDIPARYDDAWHLTNNLLDAKGARARESALGPSKKPERWDHIWTSFHNRRED